MRQLRRKDIKEFEDLAIGTEIRLNDYELYGSREYSSIYEAVTPSDFKELILTSLKILEDIESIDIKEDEVEKLDKLSSFKASQNYTLGTSLITKIKSVIMDDNYEESFPACFESPSDIFQATHFACKLAAIWLCLSAPYISKQTKKAAAKKRSTSRERNTDRKLGE